ncbi:MAG TPA: hypothetical protein VHM88_24550 [Candidatus Acidoferrales bacterium]|nr:hypothetical protein [Candidatus Acidoferrales bacterium]
MGKATATTLAYRKLTMYAAVALKERFSEDPEALAFQRNLDRS